MPILDAFQKKAVEGFRATLEPIIKNASGRIMVIHDLKSIENILAELSKIGSFLNIDFTDKKSFDRFERVYERNGALYLAWYEAKSKKPSDSAYLKFRPEKMVISPYEDEHWSHIVIQTARIQSLPLSENVKSSSGDGGLLQGLTDYEGRELRRKNPGETYHHFTVLCDPTRIVISPKGSVFTESHRDYYFRKRTK